MKSLQVSLGVLMLTVTAASAIVADNDGVDFDLSWHTFDGGGGASTGGNFALTGTIGQPDAGVAGLTGGSFEVRGGFWPGGIIPAPLCPADINGDDIINVTDLLAVVGNWSATGSNPADVNGDNIVNVADLLAVIAAWGVCPG